MFNSKAVQIMRSFSEDELKDFSRFVISPYFNRLKDVTALFNILKKYYPDLSPEEIPGKEKIYKKLFPGKPYHDARMRNLVSDLGQLAEKFLYMKSTESESIYENHSYMNSLLSRDLLDVFESAIKKAEKAGGSLNSHLKQQQIAGLKAAFYRHEGKSSKSAKSIFQKNDFLVGFYLNSMINALYEHDLCKNLKGYESPVNLFNEYYTSFDLKAFRDKIEANKGNFSQNELDYIEIQYNLYEMLNGISLESNFHKLLALLNKHEKIMTQQEKYELYSKIDNILIMKVYANGVALSHLQLVLFKEIIAKQAYFSLKTRAIMPAEMYLRGVDLALSQGQAGFIDFMLESLVHITPSQVRQSLISCTKAKLELGNKNFEASLAHLAKAEQRTTALKEHVKGLELLLHYELGRFVSGRSLAAAFREELRKAGVLKGMYAPWYDNFLNYYNELIEMRSQKTGNSNDFKTRLNDTVKVMYKPWLQEKISVLK